MRARASTTSSLRSFFQKPSFNLPAWSELRRAHCVGYRHNTSWTYSPIISLKSVHVTLVPVSTPLSKSDPVARSASLQPPTPIWPGIQHSLMYQRLVILFTLHTFTTRGPLDFPSFEANRTHSKSENIRKLFCLVAETMLDNPLQRKQWSPLGGALHWQYFSSSLHIPFPHPHPSVQICAWSVKFANMARNSSWNVTWRVLCLRGIIQFQQNLKLLDSLW